MIHPVRCCLAATVALLVAAVPAQAQSVAREWNELLMESIRKDFARPTIHARNLFHTSVAMYDAWAAYDATADQWLINESQTAADIEAAREEAISFAAYRVLISRFEDSPGSDIVLPMYDALMDNLGYDKANKSTVGNAPAAFGNRVAATVLNWAILDGANELLDYENQVYEPVNEPLLPDFPGNPDISDQNRWQPLALKFFVDQSGNIIIGGFPPFLGPEWGQVIPFALKADDADIFTRDGFDYWVYHDPGPPPYHGGTGDAEYKTGFEQVVIWASHLDPTDGVMIDIGPSSWGNAPTPEMSDIDAYYDFFNGGDWGTGYNANPVTGGSYTPNMVPRGDFARVLAEFWADGPDSETPPGHWNVLLNEVTDTPGFERRWRGVGPILPDLEYDVKSYLAMNGAMHDCAVAAWGVKGWYDYIRPISAIRYMVDQGQSSDPGQLSFDPNGIGLHPGYIEVVTAASSAPGERHEGLTIGKIAFKCWRGPDYIFDPETDVAGVGWIHGEDWWSYQRPTFVTPPFAGYVSGHSTFSRAAAEVMELLTGSPYFPGGLGEFVATQNEYLVFEDGPSQTVTLQWASYQDAADQSSMSRIWGGIHPPVDDIPGRHIGAVAGPQAFHSAERFYNGRISCPADINGSGVIDILDLLAVLGTWGTDDAVSDINEDGVVDILDLLDVLGGWGACP